MPSVYNYMFCIGPICRHKGVPSRCRAACLNPARPRSVIRVPGFPKTGSGIECFRLRFLTINQITRSWLGYAPLSPRAPCTPERGPGCGCNEAAISGARAPVRYRCNAEGLHRYGPRHHDPVGARLCRRSGCCNREACGCLLAAYPRILTSVDLYESLFCPGTWP